MRLIKALELFVLLSAGSRGETRADGPTPTVGAVAPPDGVSAHFWKTEKTPSRVKHPNSL
jgi:hypothetical protein